ncbi:MAG TPA: YciI-like protein [Steroidobacteraceae bacterium]|nr:YciI-like protein [Steroidobacteraceae bacterium]
MHYVMLYEYSPDYLERRGQFRSDHLRLAWESNARDELQLGGAFADPADGALLIFKCDSANVPEKFAAADPYVKNGLVTRRTIRAWTTVIGHDATTPVR